MVLGNFTKESDLIAHGHDLSQRIISKFGLLSKAVSKSKYR